MYILTEFSCILLLLDKLRRYPSVARYGEMILLNSSKLNLKIAPLSREGDKILNIILKKKKF